MLSNNRVCTDAQYVVLFLALAVISDQFGILRTCSYTALTSHHSYALLLEHIDISILTYPICISHSMLEHVS